MTTQSEPRHVSQLRFDVPGEPVPWKRPENNRWGGRRNHPRQEAYQAAILTLATAHARRQGWRHTGEPLALGVVAVHRRPRQPRPGHPCHGHDGRAWLLKDPDLSNIIKAVEDALQGPQGRGKRGQGVITDDNVIVRYLDPVQVYAAVGEAPHLEVVLQVLPHRPPQRPRPQGGQR